MAEKHGTRAGQETLPPGSFERVPDPGQESRKACLIVIRGRAIGLQHELESGSSAVIGRDSAADVRLEDAGTSRRHAIVEACPEGFLIRDLESSHGLFVNGVRTERHVLENGDRMQFGAAIVKYTVQDPVEVDYQKRLYRAATHDALTGAYNRRFLLESLEQDFDHARRRGSELSVLLIDMDHFKAVNDEHGHAAGDAVLEQVTSLIRARLRPEDLLCRYGGEELAVLLRFTDRSVASAVAERVRRAVEAAAFRHGGKTLRATASVGAATLSRGGHASPDELLEDADRALYRAKALGRNRAVTAAPPRRQLNLPPPSGDPDATLAPGRSKEKPPAPGSGPKTETK